MEALLMYWTLTWTEGAAMPYYTTSMASERACLDFISHLTKEIHNELIGRYDHEHHECRLVIITDTFDAHRREHAARAHETVPERK